MPLSPVFIDYALELLAGVGRVEARWMFGGAGLFRDGVIYVRVDDALQADLQPQGSVPWVYSMKRDGAVRDMGYWRLPETAADDPDEAIAIGKRAHAAAIKRKTLREARPAGKKAIAPRKDSRSAEAADKPAKRHK